MGRLIVDTDEIEFWAGKMFRASPLPYASVMAQLRAVTWYMSFGVWTVLETARMAVMQGLETQEEAMEEVFVCREHGESHVDMDWVRSWFGRWVKDV